SFFIGVDREERQMIEIGKQKKNICSGMRWGIGEQTKRKRRDETAALGLGDGAGPLLQKGRGTEEIAGDSRGAAEDTGKIPRGKDP
ncbi:MAG: hypothetical protein IIV62_06385, partial [Anaerotignum sp.]|nr:hypothetical protein [Anaerotignum sp.]